MSNLLSKVNNRQKITIGLVLVLALFILLIPSLLHAKFGDCPPGYFFDRNSGVGCKQTYCNDIPNAHWSYEGRCVCGSSGSENEDPNGPNKECFLPQTDTSCPGCIAQCVKFNQKCPGEFGVSDIKQQEDSKGLYWMVEDAFSKFMSIGGDLLDAATGIKIKEKTDTDAFYEGTVILPDGKYADIQLFHLNLEANKEKGLAFEFNILEIKSPDQKSFIDNWSFGIGLGSVSKDGGSTDVPGTPISPGINFSNIKNWFSEKKDNVTIWWRDNAPWFLGGGEPSPIPGFNKNS
jgi:hypothetical protein